MSWQEELRQLDEELAAGRLSADEYRVRRDQVLSSAVTQDEGPAAAPQGAPPAQPEQQDDKPAADSTQVISAVGRQQGDQQQPQSHPAADQNQAAPSTGSDSRQDVGHPWQAQPPRQQGPSHQGHSATPAGGFQQQPQPQQQPQQQPWNAPQQDVTPPWGGSEFPPADSHTSAEWTAQGPESFDDKPDKSSSKIAAVAATIVLLGGVAFGAYWLWGRGDDSPSSAGPAANTAAQGPAGVPSPTSKPEDELPIAELAGSTEDHPEVERFSDVPELNYLNDDELGVYEKADPGKAKFQVQHSKNDNLVIFLLVKTTGVDDPAKLEEKLADIQIGNGAEAKEDEPEGTTVTKYEGKNDSPSQIRAHYFSGDTLVRVEVVSKDSIESADKQFKTVIKKQLEELPADA